MTEGVNGSENVRGQLGEAAAFPLLELDMGRQEMGAMGLYLQRLRIMGRVVFGQDVSGYSIGIGMSF